MADCRQIDHLETQVTPIGDLVDPPKLVARGDFILHLFKRGDVLLRGVPDVAAERVLAGGGRARGCGRVQRVVRIGGETASARAASASELTRT
jgi:hypothetical protein